MNFALVISKSDSLDGRDKCTRRTPLSLRGTRQSPNGAVAGGGTMARARRRATSVMWSFQAVNRQEITLRDPRRTSEKSIDESSERREAFVRLEVAGSLFWKRISARNTWTTRSAYPNHSGGGGPTLAPAQAGRRGRPPMSAAQARRPSRARGGWWLRLANDAERGSMGSCFSARSLSVSASDPARLRRADPPQPLRGVFCLDRAGPDVATTRERPRTALNRPR
jgi:hypothetical protein